MRAGEVEHVARLSSEVLRCTADLPNHGVITKRLLMCRAGAMPRHLRRASPPPHNSFSLTFTRSSTMCGAGVPLTIGARLASDDSIAMTGAWR